MDCSCKHVRVIDFLSALKLLRATLPDFLAGAGNGPFESDKLPTHTLTSIHNLIDLVVSLGMCKFKWNFKIMLSIPAFV